MLLSLILNLLQIKPIVKFTDEGSPEHTMYLFDVTVLWLPVLKW